MGNPRAETLDLSGLKCPMPALLLRRALKSAQPGDVIEVIATDPMAEIDLSFAATQAGAEVMSCSSHDGRVTLSVRK